MTFPAPPLVAIAYYTVSIAAFGLIAWLYIRAGKLPADAGQRKPFTGPKSRYWAAMAVVFILWIVVQVLLAEFVPTMPRLNP